MNLTAGQQLALDMIKRIAKARDTFPAVGVVRGFAGTGKTTLLKIVAEELGGLAIVTPTGKAALRVREATGQVASTIHRWMYTPAVDDRTGFVQFKRKEKVDRPISGLLVIDEASMVDEDLWLELFDACRLHRMNIIAVGDAFQLPPVSEKPFSLLDDSFPFTEQVMLDEVVRQALENPIIGVSVSIRKGMVDSALENIGFVVPSKLEQEALRLVDNGGALICHTNARRHALNTMVRTGMGYDNELTDGEPLLVLKNDSQLGVYNGEIIEFEKWHDKPRWCEVSDRYKRANFGINVGKAKITSESIAEEPEILVRGKDGEHYISREYATLALEEIQGKTDTLVGEPSGEYPDLPSDHFIGMSQPAIASAGSTAGFRRTPHLHANYGYTLTCHKAQGSEWDDVIVGIEPRMNLYRKDTQRWLYTALTRAKERVRICYLKD